MEDNLVKPHPRDEVLVAAQKFKEKQELDKQKKRESRLEEERREEVRRNETFKQNTKRVYKQSFSFLAGKYLELDHNYCASYLQSLSDIQLIELESYIYARAKRWLWLKKSLVVSIGLIIPVIGWVWLSVMLSRDVESFPSHKFVFLRDWYNKEFGQISFGDRKAAMTGGVVTPNIRD